MENISRNQTPNIIKVLTKYILMFKSHKKNITKLKSYIKFTAQKNCQKRNVLIEFLDVSSREILYCVFVKAARSTNAKLLHEMRACRELLTYYLRWLH